MRQRCFQEVFLILLLLKSCIRIITRNVGSRTLAKDGRFTAIFLRVPMVTGRTMPSSSGTFILKT